MPAADSMSVEGRIEKDLSCVGCGYNLRTLSLSAGCPECGLPVSKSLERYDPAQIRKIAASLKLSLAVTLASWAAGGPLFQGKPFLIEDTPAEELWLVALCSIQIAAAVAVFGTIDSIPPSAVSRHSRIAGAFGAFGLAFLPGIATLTWPDRTHWLHVVAWLTPAVVVMCAMLIYWNTLITVASQIRSHAAWLLMLTFLPVISFCVDISTFEPRPRREFSSLLARVANLPMIQGTSPWIPMGIRWEQEDWDVSLLRVGTPLLSAAAHLSLLISCQQVLRQAGKAETARSRQAPGSPHAATTEVRPVE